MPVEWKASALAASGVMRQVLVKVISESYHQELREIACPVDLVWGADDDQVPPAVAEKAIGLLRQGTLTILKGVGHDVPAQAPTFLVARIEEHRHRLRGGDW